MTVFHSHVNYSLLINILFRVKLLQESYKLMEMKKLLRGYGIREVNLLNKEIMVSGLFLSGLVILELYGGRACSSAVEHLPSTHSVLNLKPCL